MTLRMMRSLAMGTQGATSAAVRQLALHIVRDVAAKDYEAEAVAVQSWVQGHIRYVRDVLHAETLQTPERTLANEQGDCDDHATLVSALLTSIGANTRFVAIGWAPGKWGHVLCEVLTGAGWLPLETTRQVHPGWWPAGVVSTITQEV